ncbi:phosphoribosylglycinamide formyltransferase [Henriciella sp.]|uniref:phosphoribosylglycinamide formyltransferase n=1 Tax=Henriciella sp. TaxID=1968823 RepID=UPI0026303D6A|nr:phosphoribosylglycinamide formyltransferase [Henriciella sp.]
MKRLRLAILISGRGSNMEQLLKACQDDAYPAQPVVVISNRADASGLSTARGFNVRAVAIPHKNYESRESFENEIDRVLCQTGVDIIALAGFMRVLTPGFVSRWAGRMINIHPSLLPKYPGLDTHRRAIEAGDKEAGCSVHWVTEGVDEGDVIAQSRVPVKAGDTAGSLSERVLLEEHALYPKALAKACELVRKKPSS